MVFYFSTTHEGVTYTLYMGRDKVENEELIKFGWPEDVWFHVDALSSAHVYVRLPADMAVDSIPKGCKLARCKIVYTMWSNLRKTGAMAVGQVGFHDEKAVRRLDCDKDNSVWNRIKKTMVEKSTAEFIAEREARDKAMRIKAKKERLKQDEADKKEKERRRLLKEQRSYAGVFDDESEMTSNEDFKGKTVEEAEDDFM